jgi:transposase
VEFLPEERPEWLPNRRDHEQATLPQSLSGLQGESGLGRGKGERNFAELAQQFDVHPNQITQWEAQLLDVAAGVFGLEKAGPTSSPVDVKTLHAKIGELTLGLFRLPGRFRLDLNALILEAANLGRSFPAIIQSF